MTLPDSASMITVPSGTLGQYLLRFGTMAAFFAAFLSVFCFIFSFVTVVIQVYSVLRQLQKSRLRLAAVAAVRTAVRYIKFSAETDMSVSAFTGADIIFALSANI